MQAVLFDMDGTLADTSEGVFRCFNLVLKTFGITLDPGFSLRNCIGPPIDYSFRNYFGLDGSDIARAEKVFRTEYFSKGVYECCLFEGMDECVRRIKDAGYITTVASSKPVVMCNKILDRFGIADLFDVVAGAVPEKGINTKEEVLNDLFERLPEVKKEDMLLIGDSIYDVEGANLTGIKCLAVEFGFGDAGDMVENGAVGRVAAPQEIPEAVFSYFKEKLI